MDQDTLYREILMERLANPVGEGYIEDPTVETRLVNPLCGDTILLQIKIKNNVIEQAVYSGNGCAISQVSASFLTEAIVGEDLNRARQFSINKLLEKVGINPGPARLKCASLSLEALEKALKKI